MIGEIVRALCVLSVLCGVLLSLTPEGNLRRIAELACSCLLILSVLKTAGAAEPVLPDIELEVTAREKELSAKAAKTEDELNGLVIQRECEEYIMEKADELGVELSGIVVELQRTEEKEWHPWSVTLEVGTAEGRKSALSGIIRTDLGIPYERQSWHEIG